MYRDLATHPAVQYLAWICLPVFLVLFASGFVHILAPQAIGKRSLFLINIYSVDRLPFSGKLSVNRFSGICFFIFIFFALRVVCIVFPGREYNELFDLFVMCTDPLPTGFFWNGMRDPTHLVPCETVFYSHAVKWEHRPDCHVNPFRLIFLGTYFFSFVLLFLDQGMGFLLFLNMLHVKNLVFFFMMPARSISFLLLLSIFLLHFDAVCLFSFIIRFGYS